MYVAATDGQAMTERKGSLASGVAQLAAPRSHAPSAASQIAAQAVEVGARPDDGTRASTRCFAASGSMRSMICFTPVRSRASACAPSSTVMRGR